MGEIAGPRGPIQFERDALGYPRIRARDVHDGAWARGWLHAVDRLVQVQLALVVAQGRSMEIFGPSKLFRGLDRAVRSFDFVSDAQAQVEAMKPATGAMVDAYCSGFNAGVAKRGWPLVLRALGLKHEAYTPAKMITLQRLYWYFGLTQMQHIAEGLLAEIAMAGAGNDALELLAGEHVRGADLTRLTGLSWPADAALLGPTLFGGSNAIAIAGARSKSGGALLLAEPHFEVARHPPVAYASHTDLDGGGSYQGIGLPGLWFLSFGRSESVGFAYTYGHGDGVDFLVERCRNGTYLAAGEWRPLRRRVETVKIKGRKSEQWIFWMNDYGTVLGDASKEADLPCIRWTGLREMAAEMDAMLAVTTTTTAAGFASAVRPFRSLSLHGVFADSQGDIAYVQTGQVDTRADGWSDPLPWPAWESADRSPKPLDEACRPTFANPEVGYIVSANEARQGPRGERWCTFPEPRYRHERLTELVAAVAMHDLSTLARASYDPVDACARRMMAVWGPLLPADAASLAAWAAAQPARTDQLEQIGAFHALHEEVVRELLTRRLGTAQTTRILDDLAGLTLYHFHLDDALALERPHLLGEVELRQLLAAAWPRAHDRRARSQVPVPVRTKFKNMLTQGKLPLFLGFDTGPVTFPGGPTTPFQSRAVDLLGERVVFGPGCHYLTDMSKPGGWYNLPGGASEKRFGPGYGRGVDTWLRGEFLPIGDVAGPPPIGR